MKNIIFYMGYEDELSLALIRKIFSQLENNYLIGAKFPGKRFLIRLVRSSSKNKLKKDIVPAKNSTASIGKNYNEPLVRFVMDKWDVNKAIEHSESLKRMIERLQTFKAKL